MVGGRRSFPLFIGGKMDDLCNMIDRLRTVQEIGEFKHKKIIKIYLSMDDLKMILSWLTNLYVVRDFIDKIGGVK